MKKTALQQHIDWLESQIKHTEAEPFYPGVCSKKDALTCVYDHAKSLLFKDKGLPTMSKTLHLPITLHWFTEIAEGRKSYEYRRIIKHWVSRICKANKGAIGGDLMDKHRVIAHNIQMFDTITLTAGYRRNAPRMVIENRGISIGQGDTQLGAPENEEVFIISLGKILELNNYEKSN